ncbi:apolipoprotein N-acyltransferase [Hyphococcus sp.]|uniref:apolipoprotein N-acyltransferase n=1 Tax=Hyphococcus sp. TaxID=2038636 RepID=UPI003CCC0ABD
MNFWRKPLAKFAGWLGDGAIWVQAAKGWRRRLIAFFAGAAAALSMAPVYALPLLAVGFTVLVLLIDASQNHARVRLSAFAAGWFFGFGYFLAGVYWMSFSLFVQADQFAWMAPFAILGVPAFLAIFSGAACAAAAVFWRSGWSRVFWFAAVWAAVEYIRGHIFTGLPWNLAGQAFAGGALGAQTAAWYGAYGLSLVAVLLSASPAATLSQNGVRALSGIGLMLTGVILLFAVGAVRLALPEPQGDGQTLVRIVQPNIPQREKIQWDMWSKNFNRQLEHSTAPAPPGVQTFIIWPENGAPLLDEATSALAVLSRDLPDQSVLIAGAVRRERDEEDDERFFNSIAIVEKTPEGMAVTDHYDKHHLVPLGEYLPFYDLLKAIGLAQLTPYGDAGFMAGGGPRVLHAAGSAFAPMICYEAIFPGASYPRGARPDWLVVVTNDAWFGDTSGPRQHLDMARLRSVEAGLPMARSANTGVSALIDGKGRILARLKLYTAGKIDAPLPPPLAQTIYGRFGDWIFLVMMAGFIGFSFHSGGKRQRSG